MLGTIQDAMSRGRDDQDRDLRLRCYLVSLELPWEAVAHDILKAL